MAVAKKKEIVLSKLNIEEIEAYVVGASPYVQSKVPVSTISSLSEKNEKGGAQAAGGKREAKTMEQMMREKLRISLEGWYGIPANAIRSAMLDAAALAGLKKTVAKKALFIPSVSMDVDDGMPLIRLYTGEPQIFKQVLRIPGKTTSSLVVRPMFRLWKVHFTVQFDSDQFNNAQMYDLVQRAGMQVGIGEARPYSPRCNGLGYGTWKLVSGLKEWEAFEV